MSRRPLVAGNWKMNGASADLATFGAIVDGRMEGVAETLIHPPATLIAAFASLARESHVGVGAQDCHPAASGAHTGDLSAEMLRDAGAEAVIVGHSERRADHGETDAIVRAKAEAVLRAGLLAIICVGETRDERDAGRAVEVVQSQLTGSLPDSARASTVVVAYEPVWAIGTGLTATTDDIAEIHGAVRASLAGRFGAAEADAMRVLYGGSVKPGNAAEIFALADVDGGLVGGASLKAEDFLAIAAAAD